MQHHGAVLRELTGDEATVRALAADWRDAKLPARLRAILRYAEKLTRSPDQMRREDVETLRAGGLSDEDVLHVCEVVSYYNFVNRMADGLGVTLEPDWPHELVGTADAEREPGAAEGDPADEPLNPEAGP